jgi:uncharacterized protein (TIGR01777 family)
MSTTTRVYRTDIPATPEELLAWHAASGAFERLTPPWRRVDVVETKGMIAPGDRKTVHVPVAGPFGFDWTLEHEAIEGVAGFADVQIDGPFRSWRHDHRFLPERSGGSVLEDRVTWELPAGFGLAGTQVQGELDRLFALRHERTRIDLGRLGEYTGTPLRIAVTGSSGLVGTRLVAFLRAGGHEVIRIVRHAPKRDDEVFWNPEAGEIDAAGLEGLDAVVHLAGVSIAGGLWTRKRKAAIRDSRVNGTHLLATTLAGLTHPPHVLVSTSAVGYYGDRGEERLTEASTAGEGFLAGVVQEWEDAAIPAAKAGIRVVHPRFGVVLAGEGGMLPLISLPFRFGVGGPLGSGRQYLSWIGLDDLVGILFESIVNESLDGPINAVAPEPVTNAHFSRILAKVLHRPALVRTPAAPMKLAAGQLADEVILVSQRVEPTHLEAAGFRFAFPSVELALRHELGRYDGVQRSLAISSRTGDQQVAWGAVSQIDPRRTP